MATLKPGADGYVTVNSLPLATPGFFITDISPMHNGRGFRGEDLLIPQLAGRVAIPRRKDVWMVELPMIIVGHVDSDGNANADRLAGLQDNIDEITAAFQLDESTIDPLEIVWTRASGSALSGEGYANLVIGESHAPIMVRAVVELTIPSGTLT